MTGAIVIGATIAGMFMLLALAGLVAVIVIASVDPQDGRSL